MTTGSDDENPSWASVSDSHPKPITHAVITAVAAAAECDRTAVQPPLYEVVDPDALNALYQHVTPHVTFDYAGYRVEIQPDQTVDGTHPSQ